MALYIKKNQDENKQCVVFWFYESVGGVTYKASVIMTTGYTVGAALEKIVASENVSKKVSKRDD